MKALVAMGQEIIGLFVDDGSLALSILGVVAIAAVLAFGFDGSSSLVGAILAFGCLAALAVSTLRAGNSS